MTGEEIARELGIHYDGYQKGIGMQFTDIQQTGSTFYAGTLEIARTKLAKRRELFGQQDEDLNAPTVTLYHGTSKEVAARALKEGLQPQPGVETDFPSTYLAYDPLGAAKYGEIVLRIELPREELKYMQETIPGYMRTTYPVESRYISVHSGNPYAPTGTCYSDAWRYVARHTEDHPVLVHGTVVGIHGRMGHAWVELPDGTVYDAASQVMMLIEKYYSLVDPIVEDRYTADEAMHMLSVGRHGPWNAEERMEHIGR